MLSLFDVKSARNTLNSQSAAYDALSLAPDSKGNSSQPAVSLSPNSSLAPAASLESPPVFSPTSSSFLATVASAVHQVISARQTASLPVSSSLTSVAISGGVPAPPTHASQLAVQASSFAVSGAGFAPSPSATATPVASGRPNPFVIPTSVSTFSTPIPSLAFSSSSTAVNAAATNAAATNLTDWSQLNSTFSFHSAGWSTRSPRDATDGQNEPRGAASSQSICKSWNRGHCVAPSAFCPFAHKCASCHGPHCDGVCPAETLNKPSLSSKRSPDSPPSRPSSKSCRV